MNATVSNAMVSARWGVSRIMFVLAGVVVWASFFYWATAGSSPGYGLLHPDILLWVAGHWAIAIALAIIGVLLSPNAAKEEA